MTKQEAMQRFGITSEDSICKENVQELLETTRKQLNTWSLTKFDIDRYSKDCEAYLALLK